MPDPIAAAAVASAYQATQQGASPSTDGFGATLQRAIEGAVEVGRSADAASTNAMLGQGSVTDVVLAIQRAEVALQTAVTVRDKVIAAYQDVMRMPI